MSNPRVICRQLTVDLEEYPPDLISDFGFHDTGNARRFVAACGRDVRFCCDTRKWRVWSGRRWDPDGGGRVEMLAKEAMALFLLQAVQCRDATVEKFANNSLNAVRIRNLLDLAKSEPEICIDKSPEVFDRHSMLLNVRNGTLDLRTFTLHPHNREHFITKLVHHDYVPDAECPRFLAFVHEIMGFSPECSEGELERIDEMVRFLQRTFGYSLTGDVSEKKVFCLFGQGNNGKTTLLEIPRRVLKEYSTQILIDTLAQKRFGESNFSLADLADLQGARFVTTSEGEAGQRLAAAKLKYLSAGMGRIKSCRKYENFVEFDATCKLFLDSNFRPAVRVDDVAVWNRLRCIPFTVTIPQERIDPHLADRILEEEAEGVLAWMVEGCRLWQREGLGNPEAIREAQEEWRGENDPLRDFVADRCVLAENARVASTALWASYESWCREMGEKFPATRRTFGECLKRLGCEPGRSHGGERVWKGIGLER
jgi:putative DNA primase/helicase